MAEGPDRMTVEVTEVDEWVEHNVDSAGQVVSEVISESEVVITDRGEVASMSSMSFRGRIITGFDRWVVRRIRHTEALTWRSSGSGSYRTLVRGALSRADSSGQNWGSQPVYSVLTDSCATQNRTNATSRTCTSSWFSQQGRYWWNTSTYQSRVGTGSGWDSTWYGNQYYDCSRHSSGNVCVRLSSRPV